MNKWDDAHMRTAENYAQLSSAKRLQVGCVIVKDHRIISIGYNGMPSGWTNECEDLIPEKIDYERQIFQSAELKTKPEVIHAESNAIVKCARHGESTEGATMYVTHEPCIECAKLAYQSGISRLVYKHQYPKGSAGVEFLQKCGLKVRRIDKDIEDTETMAPLHYR